MTQQSSSAPTGFCSTQSGSPAVDPDLENNHQSCSQVVIIKSNRGVPFQWRLASWSALNLSLCVTLASQLTPELEGAHPMRDVLVDAASVGLELDDTRRLAVAAALVIRIDGNSGLVLGAWPEIMQYVE